MTTTTHEDRLQVGGFRHEAVLYAGEADFVEQMVPFITEGLARGQPVLAVVNAHKIELLGSALGRDAGKVAFADMTRVGHNPARIIPAWDEFVRRSAGSGRPARGIGEPIWAGRSADELAECHIHESLLNVAFADAQMWLVCPYDTTALEPSVVDTARRTHPLVATDGTRSASEAYTAPAGLHDDPLLDPPPDAHRFDYDVATLRTLRAFLSRRAEEFGLPPDLGRTLVFVANELATNSLRYGGGRGALSVWHRDRAVVCEVCDGGHIRQPLAGRVRPTPEQEGGRGLWLANQLCDLVQVRTAPTGTTIRIHLAR
jgi:anti-sigma regulatory factor (Ser/Thr protein kinase)